MASSDKSPAPAPPKGSDATLERPMSIGQHMPGKGAEMMQSLKPIKQISQHVCTFATHSHDMSRQIETHHYCHCLNQDFLQCAVYDSEAAHARLLGRNLVFPLSVSLGLSLQFKSLRIEITVLNYGCIAKIIIAD